MGTVLADRVTGRDVNPVREVPEYSVHLDAARGAAASLVFLVHLRLFFLQSLSQRHPASSTSSLAPAKSSSELSHARTDYAHQAVMVFFVLSGFLVGGSVLRMIRRGQWSWKRYFIHRSVRLWMVLVPALVLGLLLDTAGSHFFAGQGTLYSAPPGQELILPGFQSRLSPLTFLGNLFFVQTILVTPLGSNQPLWSLANEFWYYLAFPCLAIALLLPIALWRRALAIALMAGILVFVGPKIAMYFTIWLLGAGAAAMPLKIPRRFQRAFVWVALACFIAGNLLVRYPGADLFPEDFLLGCLFLIFLYGVMHFQEPSRDSLYRRASRFMSKVSYSLYLTHGPIFCLMSAVLVGSFRLLPLNGHTILILLEVVAIAFAAACGVHYFFEARTDKVRNYLEARL